MSKKHTAARTAALAAATLLMSAATMGPALADHDHGQGKSQDSGSSHAAEHRQNGADHGPSARADKPEQDAKPGHADHGNEGDHGNRGNQGQHSDAPKTAGDHGQGAERGNGHTPVTVCHVLGNGGYHLLTMDDNALQAHLNHGDEFPEGDTCPAAEAPSDDLAEDEGPAKPEHERVTVCHLLGNGGSIMLTFDSHALPAHLAHGDFMPTEQTGCGYTVPEQVPGATLPDADMPDVDVPEVDVTTNETNSNTKTEITKTITQDTVVAGVEAFAPQTGTKTSTETVLGAEATRTVNTSAPVTGPLAGILPQTGAGQLGLALLSGLVLMAGGATILVRRRGMGVR